MPQQAVRICRLLGMFDGFQTPDLPPVQAARRPRLRMHEHMPACYKGWDRGYLSQYAQITRDSCDPFMHLDTSKADKATEIPSSSLHSTSELKGAATDTTSGSDTSEKKGDQ